MDGVCNTNGRGKCIQCLWRRPLGKFRWELQIKV